MHPDLIDLNDMWVSQELDPDIEKDIHKSGDELHTPKVSLSVAPFENSHSPGYV